MIKDTKIGVKGMEVWKKESTVSRNDRTENRRNPDAGAVQKEKYEKGTFVFLERTYLRACFF